MLTKIINQSADASVVDAPWHADVGLKLESQLQSLQSLAQASEIFELLSRNLFLQYLKGSALCRDCLTMVLTVSR